MVRLVERYGWPTYTAWGGLQTDFSHSQYLLGFRSVPVSPYTTMEYSLDRVRLMPAWTAAGEPYRMHATTGILPEKRPRVRSIRTGGRTSTRPRHAGWCSCRRARPRCSAANRISRWQRRIDCSIRWRFRDSARFDVMLLTTTAPDRVDSLDQREARGGETVVLQSPITPEPRLVAFEAMGIGATHVDARIRYGIVPPPPLSAMAPREIAISDPALIDVRNDVGNLQLPDESLLDHLLGTTILGFRPASHRPVLGDVRSLRGGHGHGDGVDRE